MGGHANADFSKTWGRFHLFELVDTLLDVWGGSSGLKWTESSIISFSLSCLLSLFLVLLKFILN